ncbi:MAG: monovalent cation/H(+) antiporter subunit G [Rhizobiaceae bacterium]
MNMFIDILSWISLLGGGACVIIGSIGTTRFPDFWSRLHAASVTDSAGMLLLVLGMCLQAGFTLITVKLIIIGIFLFITGPTTTHAVANAAWVSGLRPDKNTSMKNPEEK